MSLVRGHGAGKSTSSPECADRGSHSHVAVFFVCSYMCGGAVNAPPPSHHHHRRRHRRRHQAAKSNDRRTDFSFQSDERLLQRECV